MTVLAFPRRAKRCDSFALSLVRAQVIADLTESKHRESRALRALVFLTRLYIAFAWALTIAVLVVLTLALPAYCVGLLVGWLTR